MKTKSKEQSTIKENDTQRFFKMLAAFFTLIAIYTIIENPMGVLEGIIDCLK